MAKYYFTSGKRKGKVYEEFYYTLNGQQIVNKKSFYCPVNTKWLSKEEFKQYILQLIRDEYPNYVVVDELPEQLEDHIIYFLKQVNPDESIYYDVYVYDNEELKQIVFKGGDSSDLDFIKQVINDLTSNSLMNVYDTLLPANKNVITDGNGYLTTTDSIHLYCHHYYYDRSGAGELNYIIYTTKSTEMSLLDIYNFLVSIGSTSADRAYPVGGYSGGGQVVGGIFASTYGSGSLVQREYSIVYYSGTSTVTQRWNYYSHRYEYHIAQVF